VCAYVCVCVIILCVSQEDRYRWAKCKSPMSLVRLKKAGVPLPDQHLEVIEPSLVWEDFQVRPPPLLLFLLNSIHIYTCTETRLHTPPV
jgi:hypothetical protein